MKLPSLTYLIQQAGQSFLRFHLSIIAALVAVGMGLVLNEADDITNKFPYINIMLCAALGISLFFCVDVFADNKGYDKRKRLLLELFVILVLIAIFFTLPDSDSTRNTTLPYIRYAIYSITAHLLVAVIPFLTRGKLNGFWHYNKILFVRILTSGLYSGFLFAGLTLALGSLDFLFDIDLHNELYLDLFIVISGLFNTWFFVAGIPGDFDDLEAIHKYPKGIKIFSQYILLPLLILYLLILYIYAGKIVVLWSWPKGLVSYLIACVAVLGILTLLLIHPYGSLSGNAWIKKFSRAYYFILLPLVALLFIAIGMRVADYGITINRYVIVLLGVWLTIVCVYFSVGKTNIKFIPISLAVILMAMSFGPWGMFSVSEHSQVVRLRAILEQNNILQAGHIQQEVLWRQDSLPPLYPLSSVNTNEKVLTDSLHNEVKSILDYLDNHHGFHAIKEWYKQDIDSFMRIPVKKERAGYYRANEAETYMRSMGLKYEQRFNIEKSPYFSFYSTSFNEEVINVKGYDYITSFTNLQYNRNSKAVARIDSFRIDKALWEVYYTLKPTDKLFVIAKNDTLVFHTDSLIQKLFTKYNRNTQERIPAFEMTLYSSSHNAEGKIDVHRIAFDPATDSVLVNEISGRIYLRSKK